jgi:PiT family inorganic phosphate transporter
MGVITLALVAGGFQSEIEVPLWVKLACATVMALGTAAGGWKVIKTLGSGLIKIQPIHGFAAETAASATLGVAAYMGVPVSTTHTITGSIMGVGATRRLSAVRWGLGSKILMAWVFTLPATALLAALTYRLLNVVFGLV